MRNLNRRRKQKQNETALSRAKTVRSTGRLSARSNNAQRSVSSQTGTRGPIFDHLTKLLNYAGRSNEKAFKLAGEIFNIAVSSCEKHSNSEQNCYKPYQIKQRKKLCALNEVIEGFPVLISPTVTMDLM